MAKAVPLTGLVTGSIVFAVLAVGGIIGANLLIKKQSTSRLSNSEHKT